jgi:riboflavin kinase
MHHTSGMLNTHERLYSLMAKSSAAVIGDDALAALKHIALDGGRSSAAKISCSTLADQLDVSTQTASRRIQRLEDSGFIERDVVADGQWVTITPRGESVLYTEYAQYRRIFEADESEVELTGTVTSGMGEGKHYISLSGYMRQFHERLGYEPFPGTLNIELDEESSRTRAVVAGFDGIAIDGWEDDDRTFGPATCYPTQIAFEDRIVETAHVIIPERTHHDKTQLEIIAPVRLRDSLSLVDGDSVRVTLEADT